MTAVSQATTHSLPVQNVTVMLLAQWRIHVVLEVSVCAIVTTLDLDVTSALQVITAIPAACVSTVNVTLQAALALILAIVNAFSMLKVLPVVNANHCTGTWPKKTPRDVQHVSAM